MDSDEIDETNEIDGSDEYNQSMREKANNLATILKEDVVNIIDGDISYHRNFSDGNVDCAVCSQTIEPNEIKIGIAQSGNYLWFHRICSSMAARWIMLIEYPDKDSIYEECKKFYGAK